MVMYEGGVVMTVVLRLRTAESLLEGVLADFKTLYLESSNVQSKDMFDAFMEKTRWMLDGIKERIVEIESEEPQYKEEI